MVTEWVLLLPLLLFVNTSFFSLVVYLYVHEGDENKKEIYIPAIAISISCLQSSSPDIYIFSPCSLVLFFFGLPDAAAAVVQPYLLHR